jgi:hypothetical protein
MPPICWRRRECRARLDRGWTPVVRA